MIKTPSLGKNLSALLSTTNYANLASNPQVTVQQIALDGIKISHYQPRTQIDEQSLQELAESIKQQGLLQPILVRKKPQQEYEIVAGERRWRACQLANLTSIPAIVHQIDDQTARAVALIENLQREQLTSLDEARAMQQLHQDFNLTHKQIADLLSKSRSAVSNGLRLLELSDEVQTLLTQGKLDMGHARVLLGLAQSQQLTAAQWVMDKNLSVRATEQLVERFKNDITNLSNNNACLNTHYQQMFQQELKKLIQTFNTKVKIKTGKAGKGSLIIEYQNEGSLKQLINRLLANKL